MNGMETNSNFSYLELSFQAVGPFGFISDFRVMSHGLTLLSLHFFIYKRFEGVTCPKTKAKIAKSPSVKGLKTFLVN